MPWVWTDDLAELLSATEPVAPEAVAGWLQRPVALAVPEGTDPLEFARRLLGANEEAVA